jgi:phytoene desaturase
MKVPALFRSSYFDRFISVGDVLDYTINNDTIRQIGYVLFGVSGVSPHRLSSHYLRLDKNANGTRVGNPVHLFGGNKRVADTLTTFILAHGGRLVFNEKVERIIFEGNRASGVVTNNNNYSMDFLISNTDIRTTVLRLSQPWHWEDSYLKEIQVLNQPLALVCIFLTFDSSFELPEGFGVFFMSGDNPSEEFQALEAGCFPTQSTFSLQIPTNFEDPTPKYHRATLQFYYPKGAVSPQVLQQQIDMIMNDGLEQLFPGLTGRVVSYTVYDPTRYEQEFGLKPIVFGVSPDLNYRRLPQQTPVHNLFCVGDSVQPEKPSVPQAMESGLECARIIAARFGSTQSFD